MLQTRDRQADRPGGRASIAVDMAEQEKLISKEEAVISRVDTGTGGFFPPRPVRPRYQTQSPAEGHLLAYGLNVSPGCRRGESGDFSTPANVAEAWPPKRKTRQVILVRHRNQARRCSRYAGGLRRHPDEPRRHAPATPLVVARGSSANPAVVGANNVEHRRPQRKPL